MQTAAARDIQSAKVRKQCDIPAAICELVESKPGTLVLGTGVDEAMLLGVDGAMFPGEGVVPARRALGLKTPFAVE